jgi:hypothetical protein
VIHWRGEHSAFPLRASVPCGVGPPRTTDDGAAGTGRAAAASWRTRTQNDASRLCIEAFTPRHGSTRWTRPRSESISSERDSHNCRNRGPRRSPPVENREHHSRNSLAGATPPWIASFTLKWICIIPEIPRRARFAASSKRDRRSRNPSTSSGPSAPSASSGPPASAPCTYSESASHNSRKWPRSAASARTRSPKARLVHFVQSFPKVSLFDQLPPENPANVFGNSGSSCARGGSRRCAPRVETQRSSKKNALPRAFPLATGGGFATGLALTT